MDLWCEVEVRAEADLGVRRGGRWEEEGVCGRGGEWDLWAWWVREEGVSELADLGRRSEPILERRFEVERRVDRAGGRVVVLGGVVERGGGEDEEDGCEGGEVCVQWEGRVVGLVSTVEVVVG